ncbi:MAG: elongation factor G [Victivallaceae bacterium]|nr:elongation factor G [Victivallaceae bacterium]
MENVASCRNFVVAGHSGSGKTSLCDLLLYKSKAVDRLGSVDNRTSVSDYAPDEQEKHSSIYASCLNCRWNDHHFFFIDTPGYGEFVGEMLSSMRAADSVLVVLDGVEGPQVGTARAWKFTRLRGVPRFGLINRLDHERANFSFVLGKMRENHGKNVVLPLTYPDGNGDKFTRVYDVLTATDVPDSIAAEVAECKELLMDAIVETDETLMERYLEGEQLKPEELAQGLLNAVLSCKIIPVFAGSSTKDIGITELMDYIVRIFPNSLDKKFAPLSDGGKFPVAGDGTQVGLIFKAVNDPFIGHLAFMKVVSGVFRADTELFNVSRGCKEKIGQMFLVNGKTQTPVAEAVPGMLVTLPKLKDTHIGDTLSSAADTPTLKGIDYPVGVMRFAVTAVKSGDDDKIAAALAKFAECDPTIRLTRDEETKDFIISGMGEQHIAQVAKRLKEQYRTEINLNVPKIPYRETITAPGEGHYRHKKQSGGAGQFAEVYLRVAPIEVGFEFSNDVVGGSIPKNFIPAVEKGIHDMLVKGPLVGCTVERVKVSVYDGKYHPVDSNEMAFRIAGRMAFKDAMSKAKPVLLEPVMRVTITIPDSYMGDITGDLNHKRGRILGMGVEEGMQQVIAEVPLAEMGKYATELRSMTQGRGSFELEFARYEQIPANIAAIITAKYQPQTTEE